METILRISASNQYPTHCSGCEHMLEAKQAIFQHAAEHPEARVFNATITCSPLPRFDYAIANASVEIDGASPDRLINNQQVSCPGIPTPGES
jgi:hypothetical protein